MTKHTLRTIIVESYDTIEELQEEVAKCHEVLGNAKGITVTDNFNSSSEKKEVEIRIEQSVI